MKLRLFLALDRSSALILTPFLGAYSKPAIAPAVNPQKKQNAPDVFIRWPPARL
jgi:hypothetical protein